MMADSDYSGTTKPLERARRDEARRVAEAERENLVGLKVGKLLGEVATSRLKALYPLVEGDGKFDGRTVTQAVSHLPQATEQEVHRGGVVPQGYDGCHNPSFDQEGEFGVGRIGHIHGDSFHAAAGHDATSATCSCEGGQE